MSEYKRKKPYNKVNDDYIKKLELHLKKIEQLKNGDINKGQE